MATTSEPGNAEGGATVLPVVREELRIDRRRVDTGGVRVTKRVHEHTVPVHAQLWHDEVDLQRVAVDQVVTALPQPRYEGDVLVVPVVEEVMVIEKRYRIREELRITTVRSQREYRDSVALRVEDVAIETFKAKQGEPAPPVDQPRQERSKMSHTLAAVFNDRADAERARDTLVKSGIAIESAQLSPASSDRTAQSDPSFTDSIKGFFGSIFGDFSNDQALYGEAVNRGNCVLTVQTRTEQDIERVADIVEACGPIDIDEQKNQWEAGGWRGATAGTMGTQSGASMQSTGQQASASSVQGGSMSGTQETSMSGTQGSIQGQSGTGSMQRAETDSQVIPVMEEALKVGKRVVQRGGVRIFQRLVETPVQEDVSLREEHVNIERRPVDRPIDPSQVGTFQDASFEVREQAEEAVVQKTARVVEEVVVGKEVTERTGQIQDTVRHTEVEVEQLGSLDDEDDFRNHWSSNYASRGGTYDEFAPAYRYGSTMRSGNRSWDEAESDLRSDWESNYPQSAWEDVKDAVKRGWDKMKS